MPVVWTALIFSQLDIGKLLKRTWEDLLRVSGPCTGDQGTQKASGKVAVLSKREDFAKENWDFIWTFHFSLLKLSFPIQSKTYSVFCNQDPLSIWKCHKKMRKNGETCHKKRSFSFVTGSITWGRKGQKEYNRKPSEAWPSEEGKVHLPFGIQTMSTKNELLLSPTIGTQQEIWPASKRDCPAHGDNDCNDDDDCDGDDDDVMRVLNHTVQWYRLMGEGRQRRRWPSRNSFLFPGQKVPHHHHTDSSNGRYWF